MNHVFEWIFAWKIVKVSKNPFAQIGTFSMDPQNPDIDKQYQGYRLTNMPNLVSFYKDYSKYMIIQFDS